MTTELSKEIAAMQTLEVTLKDLSEEQLSRVLIWASDRFDVSIQDVSKGKTQEVDDEEGVANPVADTTQMSVAEYYDAASPKTDAQKVLVVAAWRSEVNGETAIDSQAVNTELKHLGYGIGNVTRAFEKLKTQKPALIIQTQKSGTSKQARKKFTVTRAGLQRVKEMMNG